MPSPHSHGASFARDADQPSSSAFRIVIVKWDVRAGDELSHLARETYPDAEVRLCRTGADALDTLRRRPATLGLFGLTLPDLDGLDLLALVADEHLAQRRMIVTGRRDEFSRQALRVARVHGVFDTSVEDSASLAVAIRQVGDGGSYFSLGATPDSASPVPSVKSPGAPRGLSFIEQQVFAIMIEGAADDRIAQRLGMTAQTVASHRANILRKLNVETSEDLQAFTRRGMKGAN